MAWPMPWLAPVTIATDFDMRNVSLVRLELVVKSARRKSRIAAAISAACVSSAKWPVSKKRTTASGMSRLNASAPGGRKNGSFLPHTARNGGLWVRK